MSAERTARTIKDRGRYRAAAAEMLDEAEKDLEAATGYLTMARDDTWAKGRPGRATRAADLVREVRKLRQELAPPEGR